MTALIDAIQEHDIALIQKILKRNPENINDYDEYGRNALLYSVIYKMDYVFDLLITSGADIHSVDTDNGKNCLHYSCENGNFFISKKLIELGIALSEHDNMRYTPLHSSINLNHLDISELLIKSGCDINNKGLNGATPLHYAAQFGFTHILSLLIKRGAGVNVFDHKLQTPFHYTCIFGHPVCAYLLLKAGAHIHKLNHEGYDAIQLAALYNQYDTVKFLLDIGYPTNNIASNNNSSLHCAIRSTNKDIVLSIIQSGCDINRLSLYGTPLHEAIQDIDLVDILLKNKADPNIKGKHGYTPLHTLCRINRGDLVNTLKRLIEYGADMNIQSDNGCTPFHLAILMNKNELVEEMKKIKNVNYHIRNKNNESIEDLLSDYS